MLKPILPKPLVMEPGGGGMGYQGFYRSVLFSPERLLSCKLASRTTPPYPSEAVERIMASRRSVPVVRVVWRPCATGRYHSRFADL